MGISNKFKVGSLVLAMGLSTTASALDLVVMGASKHFASDSWKKENLTTKSGEFNEINPGLGVWKDLDSKNAVVAGIYHNSYYKMTVYAGGSRHLVSLGDFQFRADYGLATGYSSSVVPMILPVVEYHHSKNFVTRAMVVPKVSVDTVTAIGVQWRISF